MKLAERVTIVLESLPDRPRPGGDRVPVEHRLRQLLKLALRGFGLKCVDIRASDQSKQGDA